MIGFTTMTQVGQLLQTARRALDLNVVELAARIDRGNYKNVVPVIASAESYGGGDYAELIKIADCLGVSREALSVAHARDQAEAQAAERARRESRKPTAEHVRDLLGLLPKLATPGVILFSYPQGWTPLGDEFMEICTRIKYDAGYGPFGCLDDSMRLWYHREEIATASVVPVVDLLIHISHHERLCMGLVQSAHEEGVLVALLRRLEVLHRQSQAKDADGRPMP